MLKNKLIKNNIRLITALFILVFVHNTYAQQAQQARKILDKTAAVLNNKGGASAHFTVSSTKIGSTSGTINIKANKFQAQTPQAIVWYDGKTQWSYLKRTNEVNISTPNRAQQIAMNPYTFINIYKSGYQLSSKTKGNNYQVHLVATNKRNSIAEMYILVNKNTYVPTQVKLKQANQWTTINISNFKTKNIPNHVFVFKSKDFPSAEIIDLR